ncbi:hypothetical protein D3C73_1286750 [compost metagenome]
MIDLGEGFAVEAAVVMRMQMEEPALHACDPATVGMAGDAGEHLRSFPGVHMTGQRAPALQAAGGNIDPVQGVFLRHPDRAFTYRVARIDNQFGFHGNSFA